MVTLPSFAPFPQVSWQQNISSEDQNSLVEAWLSLSQAYLGLPDDSFKRAVGHDESVATFVSSFVWAIAESGPHGSSLHSSSALLKAVYQLASRLIRLTSPAQLLDYSFLASLARVYPNKLSSSLISQSFASHAEKIELSLAAIKKLLIPHLDAGIKGDLKLVEYRLALLNPLLHVSSNACTFFLAGSDFFDGLVTCFCVMNPPLRKVIVTTIYLCIVGLTKAEPPKWAMLADELFTLKTTADTHKQGPLNANDSLVAELVTSTPLLKTLLRRAEASGAASDNFKKRVGALEQFKKGAMIRPKRLVKRRVDKGKDKQTDMDVRAEIHVHQMSQVTQIQDLFPDLGAGFISKCLAEYSDDVEQVVANLLSETLPAHLATADRTEPLSYNEAEDHQDLAPHPTPPQMPLRRNVFDDDEFDRLAIDDSKLSYGKDLEKTADDVLKDRSTAPNKAAILSALASFDSDDDERDDTYDAVDVGGTVDSTNQEADGANDGNEEVLFRAYQMDAKVFGRDAATRRGGVRSKLKEETGMSDESIEGWAVMLARNPAQMKRLEAKYAFAGQQPQLERTSWRPSPAGSGAEDSDPDGGASRGGARGGRSRGRGGRSRGGAQGRGGGNVAGPTGEKETEAARRKKEANKGSRANHNRREGRARKMARGGFAG